tara:strand:- start:2184 stop:4004 length:1821 start_codon:yes stop_codon:yes gene_type:complete
MCGIYGVICKRINELENKTVENAKKNHKKIKHRGPDWEGEYYGDNCFLAHHRLSIIDPYGGNQPLLYTNPRNNKNLILCVNGEIYNYKQIKNDYKNRFNFTSGSDCEVILPLYLKSQNNTNGINDTNIKSNIRTMSNTNNKNNTNKSNTNNSSIKELLNSLDGIFSFILHDEINNKTLVARDPLGVTTLYYGFDSFGNPHFSSEMKAFSKDIVPHVFPAGGFMYFENNLESAPQIEYYYDVDDILKYNHEAYKENIYNIKENTYLKTIHTNLYNAVEKRLQSDVPFGMLLSGGLDSSLVCSLAVKILKDKRETMTDVAWNGKIKTFCIGLEGSPDLLAAQKVADFLGTQHYNFTFTIDEGVNAIRDVIYHLESYDVTSIRASTPMFLLSRKIKSIGVKMVLSGEGSDEIFGGYLYFLNAPDNSEHTKECVRRVKQLPYFDNLRANKSTMAWGLEARVPFLDRKVVSCGLECPANLKRKNNVEKWVLRKAFDINDDDGNPIYLPKELLWRQKEQFSDGVGYSWVDRLKQIAEENISDYTLSLAKYRYNHNTPKTKEEYYYRTIFDELFPDSGREYTVKKWIPNTDWEGVGYDPSGRIQNAHLNFTKE